MMITESLSVHWRFQISWRTDNLRFQCSIVPIHKLRWLAWFIRSARIYLVSRLLHLTMLRLRVIRISSCNLSALVCASDRLLAHHCSTLLTLDHYVAVVVQVSIHNYSMHGSRLDIKLLLLLLLIQLASIGNMDNLLVMRRRRRRIIIVDCGLV